MLSSNDLISDSLLEQSSNVDEEYEPENILPVTKVASKLKKSAPKKNAGAKAQGKDKAVEEIYQKKTQLEHILLRPDTYIGSVEHISQLMWVYDPITDRMVQKTISFVPGFFKIFDEILVNAADNQVRDPEGMDTLKVDIDREKGSISIYNNGQGIPVVLHAKEGVYIPELIFGHLLTSSNYDDNTKKITGGRNGYGAKLCNIFSTEFVVETAHEGKKLKQTFSKNMSVKSNPAIGSWSREDFTKITFTPDLNKFGMTSFDDDIVALFHKRVIDLAGCLLNVKVFYNGERIKIKSFKQYVELYLKNNINHNGGTNSGEASLEHSENLDPSAHLSNNNLNNNNISNNVSEIVHQCINDRWEVCVAASDGQFQQVSFVNSINTYKGGTHVNHVVDQIVGQLVEAAQKKQKALQLKPFQVKNHLFVFIRCHIENPAFDSQTKENLTLKESLFGSKCQVPEDFVKKIISKTTVLENVLSWARFKQDQQLKKTDGSKKSRLSGIAKLDDANMAGTKHASKCTLILTEGDSAKALAVSGLAVVGRDHWGVFPLRGKLLNVREASHKQIMENAEINALKQILGLQHGKTYTSVESLRYGRIMIMTDQDHDGSHIKGLIINFLDHFWPSLLKVPGFLVEFITPIVKCTKGREGREQVSFFTLPEYEAWKEQNNDGHGWTIKYYKGLGTSTGADAKKYFSNLPVHLKEFSVCQTDERQLIEMAFSKKMADRRKDWLRDFVPGTFVDHRAARIALADFINRELILFSMADNVRSIPSVVDGLKPGHRKIMFACFKRNLKSEIKVAQLAGYVAEHSAYHHGEQSLCATIVGLAQTFVGSNNINLLTPNGQFGTRLQGGKDAASPRYIFTQLSPAARLLYRPEDDALLNFLTEDGQSIEPEWYLPIIPMALVNGGEGIGTGWSTFIPNFNPIDVIDNLKRLLRNEPLQRMHPWYLGYHGSIVPVNDEKYLVKGIWHRPRPDVLEITELPLGTWTQPYKEFLEGLCSSSNNNNGEVKEFSEYHTDTTVHFKISLSRSDWTDEELDKKFKLSTSLSLGNVVTFDRTGRIKRWTDVLDIVQDFYELRLQYYHKRKEHLLQTLRQQWTTLDNKMRFIQGVVDGLIVVNKRSKPNIIEQLKRLQFFSDNSNVKSDSNNTEMSSEKEPNMAGYDYLLSMPIYSLTLERIQKLQQERECKEQELQALMNKTPQQLWLADLDEFLTHWNDYLSNEHNNNHNDDDSGKKKKKVTSHTRMIMEDDFEEDDEAEKYIPKKRAKSTASTSTTTTTVKSTSKSGGTEVPRASKKQAIISFASSTDSVSNNNPHSISTNTQSSRKNNQSNSMMIDDDEEEVMELPLAQRIARMLGGNK